MSRANDVLPGDVPFDSTKEWGKRYFWRSGSGDDEVQHSSHPHPRLPYYCRSCDWWTDKPCPAHEPGETLSMWPVDASSPAPPRKNRKR